MSEAVVGYHELFDGYTINATDTVYTIDTSEHMICAIEPSYDYLISPGVEGKAMLEISDERLLFNDPDGRPFIEARKDGKVLIRGEEAPVYNGDIYNAFVDWIHSLGL
jgi:hypothetical protein